MKLLITGAGGFLGRYVVASAVRRGHEARAMVRPASRNAPPSWRDHPNVEIARGDLRARGRFDDALDGIDVVVHLAASKAGDLYEQFGGTVIATEILLEAITRANVDRLVVTSSFAVYEYLRRRSWSKLDESSPLARDAPDRDEYCQTKMEQERLVREYGEKTGCRCVILRPGVVFGRKNLWTARLGMQLSDRWWVRTGLFSPLPLTYVENCADAIVQAAEYEGPEQCLILNVVDDETPTQRTYMSALRRRSEPRPRIIPIPWTVMRTLAGLARLTNRICFSNTAKVPGLFVPSRLHARCKPMRYSNERVRSTLGWRPRYDWREGMDRSLREDDPAALPAASKPEASDAIQPMPVGS